MHWLAAAKSDLLWVNAVYLIALIVPLRQAGRLSFSKCGLRMIDFLCLTALGTTGPGKDTLCNRCLPFPLANRALPFSPKAAASHHLLWCLFILAVAPVLSYIRCYGSKGVVHAHPFITAEGAACASCSALNRCCPDVWLSSWAIVALPHSLLVTVRLDLDWTQVAAPVGMPLLLQLRAQQTDVW